MRLWGLFRGQSAFHWFTACPQGGGDCRLPPTNKNNLTTYFHQWIQPQKSAFGVSSLFSSSKRNTGHCQADGPPPVKHTEHHFFSLCGRSLNWTAGWVKLSGNSYLDILKECNSKSCEREKKCLLCGLWRVSSTETSLLRVIYCSGCWDRSINWQTLGSRKQGQDSGSL